MSRISHILIQLLAAASLYLGTVLPVSLHGLFGVTGVAHADDDDDDDDRRPIRPNFRLIIPNILLIAPAMQAPARQRTKAPPPKARKPPPTRQRPARAVARIENFEPREILAINAAPAVLNQARSLGFTLHQTVSLNRLNLRITRLRTPANRSSTQALRLVQRRIPNGDFVLNHVYRTAAEPCPEDRCYGFSLIGWNQAGGNCGRGVKLGIVDTAVNGKAPALAGRRVAIRAFADDGRASSPEHGTAVAALLVGSATSAFPGLLPEAELYAADTFVGTGVNLRTNALLLGKGLDWLLEQQAAVVNVSLTGPDNRLLHEVIKRLSAHNVVVIAAAGNGGPGAPPAFPAAYPEAVAVTAVDKQLRPYRLANRGEYVTVAAPGVRIWTPGSGGGGQYSDGTSFAAPYGAAVAALLRHRQPGLSPAALTEQLRNSVRDLGAPGKDPVFGWGLLQSPGRCD